MRPSKSTRTAILTKNAGLIFPLATQQEPLYGPLRAAETPCIVLDLHCKTPFQSLEHRGIIMISEEGWRLKSNQIYSSGLEDTLSTLV